MRHYNQPQVISYDALIKFGREQSADRQKFLSLEAASGEGFQAACLFYTSGATGRSKGVVLSHAALIEQARAAAAIDGLTHEDVALAYLPAAWVGQNLIGYAQPMVIGYCICCPESSETMLSDLREIGPTYFLATPRVLEAVVNEVVIRIGSAGTLQRGLYASSMALARRVGESLLSRKRVFPGSGLLYGLGNVLVYAPLRNALGMSNVRVAYTSGDAIAPHVLMFFRSIGINLKQVYGSTEAGFFIAMQRDGEVKPDAVGSPANGVELKFSPVGEVLVRSPGLFTAYHNDADATRKAIGADGWFHTGDSGYLGEDGQLRIVDRLSDVGAMSDGTPFTPKSIENKLKASAYIKEAVAFGAGRGSVCALIDIDMSAVGNWADKQSISYTGHADLASRPEVYQLLTNVLASVNAEMAVDPKLVRLPVRRFVILPKELDADDGLLTRMRRLRREAVVKRYGALADAMYAGQASVRDPSGDPSSPSLEICDVSAESAASTKKAA